MLFGKAGNALGGEHIQRLCGLGAHISGGGHRIGSTGGHGGGSAAHLFGVGGGLGPGGVHHVVGCVNFVLVQHADGGFGRQRGHGAALHGNAPVGDTEISFVGYPSEDGTSNHLFSTSQTFAISTTCKARDVAWNFLSQLVREDYQSGDNVWNFPVNQKAFNAKMKEAMTEEYQTDENGNQILDENGEALKPERLDYASWDFAVANDCRHHDRDL